MAYQPVSTTQIENLTDQLAHLASALKFLSALQTPASELRVAINGTVNGGWTLGVLTTLSNQTAAGNYALSHNVMSQINTNAAQLRQQIITT